MAGDGRTQAQAEIDADVAEERELRAAHAAPAEEAVAGKHAAPAATGARSPRGAHAKAAESETE